MDEKEKNEIEALQIMNDGIKELIEHSLKHLTAQKSILGMLFIVLEGVFLAAPSDIEAHKHINQIMIRAKKSADLFRKKDERK